MTREEAIKTLEESQRQNRIIRDSPTTFFKSADICEGVKNSERRIEALDMAIAALRSQQEGNTPLTMEDLWEMDGVPVWNDTMKKWVIVDLFWEHGPRTVDARGRWRDLEDRYYRRRPEEGTP